MAWEPSSIFTWLPINSKTINWVYLPPAFRLAIYVLIAFTFIIATVVLIAKKFSFTAAFRKAAVIAFFVSGIVYAVHAEVGWTKWLVYDVQTFGGLETKEKLLRIDGKTYAFSQLARDVINDDYILYSDDDTLALQIEYYLLPRRKRAQAKFIIVAGDQEARFDLTARSFTRGDVKIAPVEPVFVYAQDAYVLKRNP